MSESSRRWGHASPHAREGDAKKITVAQRLIKGLKRGEPTRCVAMYCSPARVSKSYETRHFVIQVLKWEL